MLRYEKKRKDIFELSVTDELRYKYKIKRKYFQHSAREVADGAICDVVLSALQGYESFFIYHSYNGEADTRAIIAKLITGGKRVYLPRVEGQRMDAVRYLGEEDKLIKNRFGILEPDGEAAQEDIQVAVAPLLAVNSKGYRLGYGGGYYDRFFKQNKRILKVGLGYYLQLTDEFEEQIYDEKLDLFICERGIIDFGR